MTIEKNLKKLIYIINEADRDFPFNDEEIYSLEQDKSKTMCYFCRNIIMVKCKSYNYENSSTKVKWVSQKV
jgi:hypothetical protein